MRALHRLLALLLAVLPSAAAHGGLGSGPLETRFSLPWWVAWIVGSLVVAVSYAIVAGFVTRARANVGHGIHPPPPVAPPPGALRVALRTLGVAALVLVAAHALQPGVASLGPGVLLWLGVWGLFPLLAYTVGDPWPWVSPFRALAPWAERLRGGRAPRPLPERVARWLPVVLLLGIVGLEPLASGPARAGLLGLLALAYTALTLVGVAAFGAEAWLPHAEVFERTFRWWASVRPWPARGDAGPVRPPGIHGAPDVAFTIALLYGVNFDGFLATRPGRNLLSSLSATLGDAAAHGVLLVAGFLLFWAAYAATAAAVRRAAETLQPGRQVAARFVASLLPIAAAYHLAHNAFYLVENAPLAAALVEDPLGRGMGWDLAGAPGPLSVPAEWGVTLALLQMAIIVLGHVGAVLAAHALAWASFPSRIQALKGELPLTVAMVAYTLVGLWIVTSAAPGVAA